MIVVSTVHVIIVFKGFYDTIYGSSVMFDSIVSDILVIDSGSSLIISRKVQFGKGAGIIVLPGGELNINGGHLTRACNDLWRGIEVWGDPDTTQNFFWCTGKSNNI